MTKSDVSFKTDLKELTSPKNIIVGIFVPVVLTIVFGKGNIFINVIVILGILFVLVCLVFFVRWLLSYRKS